MKAKLCSSRLASLANQRTASPVDQKKGRFLDLGPIVVEAPAQIVMYSEPGPEVIEGIAQIDPDGDATITVPISNPPPVGTPVQIVIYGPTDMEPIVLEGKTGPDPGDGSLPVQIDIPQFISD